MTEEAIPTRHKQLFRMCWLPGLGVVVSFWEFIITSVYQFYFLGFALSLCMLIASAVFLFLKYRDYSVWYKTNDDSAEKDHAEYSTQMLLREHSAQEDNKKIGRWQKVLFVAYCLLVSALVVMFFARFCSLVARKDFRKNTVAYPSACSTWALHGGCTRIRLAAAQCYNPRSIPADWDMVVAGTNGTVINQAI